MRRILFEIPSAQMLAWVGAGLAVLFVLYHALRPPGKDEEGNREPFPIGSVAGGAAVAFLLVWGVALNHKAFREDVVHLKDGREISGKIVEDGPKTVTVRALTGMKSFERSKIERIRRDLPKGIPIYSYGFMMMVAFAAAIYVGTARSRASGMDPNIILDLGLWSMIAGIFGARLFYMIQFRDQFRGRPFFEYFKVWEGGIVFYGGMIGALLAGTVYVVRKKVSVRKVLDIVAPSIPLGIAFARFGCFLNGCCFGRRVEGSFPLAVRFGEGSHALFRHVKELKILPPGSTMSAPVHPTQLYSSLTAFTVFVLVGLYFAFTRKRRIDGEVFLLFAILYPVGRFLLESFREDTDPVFGTGLTISQNLSILLLAVSVPLFIWAQVKKYRGQAVG